MLLAIGDSFDVCGKENLFKFTRYSPFSLEIKKREYFIRRILSL